MTVIKPKGIAKDIKEEIILDLEKEIERRKKLHVIVSGITEEALKQQPLSPDDFMELLHEVMNYKVLEEEEWLRFHTDILEKLKKAVNSDDYRNAC